MALERCEMVDSEEEKVVLADGKVQMEDQPISIKPDGA